MLLNVGMSAWTGHLLLKWRFDAHGCNKFDLVSHLETRLLLHLRVTNLPAPAATCAVQAQQRRMERAAGKNDRMRLRKRLAQQSATNPTATQRQSSTAQTGRLNASPSKQRSTGSMPLHPVLRLDGSTCFSGITWSVNLGTVLLTITCGFTVDRWMSGCLRGPGHQLLKSEGLL